MSSGPGSARTASNTALISIRWLVVRAAGPLAKAPPGTAQAQPPGPGFPRQAPSVYTIVGVDGDDGVDGESVAAATAADPSEARHPASASHPRPNRSEEP